MSKYPNSGALFKNKEKQLDKHPDYKGSAEVGGVEYRVSSWLKKTKSGETFMTFSFTEKESQANQIKQDNGLQEDLPF